MALNVKRIETLKQPGRYGDGNGLLLKVTSSGSKSYQFRYEREGRERFMGLGPADLISLSEARELALVARKQLLAGIDPITARDEERARAAAAERARISFADATQQYFDLHEATWKKRKHRTQFLNTLAQYAYPVFGNLPVDAIDTGLVLRCLDPIWRSKTETASRVRQRIERVLAWSIVRGYRSAPNPAAWVGHLNEALPARSQIKKTEHHPALPFSELPAFMTALRECPGFAARALEFAILTAARTGEVIGARWSEIDFENAKWTVPPGRMKASKEHSVPLSPACVALLKALPRESHFVFPGSRKGTSLSNMAMATLLKRMNFDSITVHGFRSTFRDWAAESTAFPNHVIEMALAHAIGDKVEAAYGRGKLLDKRRQLMKSWADYCGSSPQSTGADVVSIRAARL